MNENQEPQTTCDVVGPMMSAVGAVCYDTLVVFHAGEWYIRIAGSNVMVGSNGIAIRRTKHTPWRPSATTILHGRVYVVTKVDRKKKRLLVSREVLKAWVGQPGDCQVAIHLNGDRLDNRLENLRWGSHKENYLARYKASLAEKSLEEVETM